MTEQEAPFFSEIDCKISSLIDEKKQEIIDLCQDLIRIPSITGEEEQIQHFIAGYLDKMGLELDIWEPDLSEMRQHPAYNDDGLGYKARPNVVGILPGTGGGRSLLLNAHSDVVEPGPLGQWPRNPWAGEIAKGRIWGRGACDDKGGIACIIKAVETLSKLKISLAGDIILEIVIGEEYGSNGNGTLASTMRGYTADGAIVAEPTSCKLMLAHRGNLFWKVVVEGKGSHAGTKYEGVSAVEKAVLLLEALLTLERERNKRLHHPLYDQYPLKAPICIGKFHGGDLIAGIPERCELEGDIEFLPGESPEEVRKELEQTLLQCADQDIWLRKHPPVIQWIGASLESAEIALDHPLVAVMEKSCKSVLGDYPLKKGMEGGCDMRIKILYGGTPTLIFGPGKSTVAHTINEYVSIEDLVHATKVIASSIVRWCS